METEGKRRMVVIAGRPNVGKSALFNRIAGKRVAIVHAQSGVTRDRILREASWDGVRFLLCDTGGVHESAGKNAEDPFEHGIRQQTEAALADAAIVILVVDVQAGLHPMDEAVASLLRNSGRQVVVAANKADAEVHEAGADEFSRLGFPVFAVSAMQRRGLDALMAAILPALPAEENVTVADPLRVVIAGRPNVGKSSYINRLLRSDRVLVSDVAGTTRDSVEIPFSVGSGPQARHYVLVDTAGMRRKGKIDTAVERFSLSKAEQSIRRAGVVVLILDAVQGPTAFDKRIAAFVQEHKRGCVILVNKWDLAQDAVTQRQYGPALVEAMPFMGHCPVVFASAKDGYNIRRTIEAIDHVAGQVTGTLPTGILNRTLHRAYDQAAPAATGGRRLKLYYATQVGRDPVTIRIFVNRPDLVQAAYETYLIRRLREEFGLEGAAVVLQFRPRSSKDSRDD
ncbi:MAG: ribosome biogenesis GTPase Der [Kiritimatiellia bacterium]